MKQMSLSSILTFVALVAVLITQGMLVSNLASIETRLLLRTATVHASPDPEVPTGVFVCTRSPELLAGSMKVLRFRFVSCSPHASFIRRGQASQRIEAIRDEGKARYVSEGVLAIAIDQEGTLAELNWNNSLLPSTRLTSLEDTELSYFSAGGLIDELHEPVEVFRISDELSISFVTNDKEKVDTLSQ